MKKISFMILKGSWMGAACWCLTRIDSSTSVEWMQLWVLAAIFGTSQAIWLSIEEKK